MRQKLYQQYQSIVAAQWFSHFLEKPFVKRVKRRSPMRWDKLDRSTYRSADAFRVQTAHDWDYFDCADFRRRVPRFAVLRRTVHLDELGEVAAIMQRCGDRGAVGRKAVCSDLEMAVPGRMAHAFNEHVRCRLIALAHRDIEHQL